MASLKARAGKVVCIGRNYAGHIAELKNATPREPFFFLKPPSSILPPGHGPVLRPPGVDLHYEVELALVMAKTVRDLDETDEEGALKAIQGYAVGIDMTARNLQDEARANGLPWDIAKGFDTFLPLSLFIAKEKVPNPHAAHLHLSVNNTVRQSDSTGLMLFRIPRILSAISHVMTLQKGDIVLTGTPKGVGSVHAGDEITAGIRVDGSEIEEGSIKVGVKDRNGSDGL